MQADAGRALPDQVRRRAAGPGRGHRRRALVAAGARLPALLLAVAPGEPDHPLVRASSATASARFPDWHVFWRGLPIETHRARDPLRAGRAGRLRVGAARSRRRHARASRGRGRGAQPAALGGRAARAARAERSPRRAHPAARGAARAGGAGGGARSGGRPRRQEPARHAERGAATAARRPVGLWSHLGMTGKWLRRRARRARAALLARAARPRRRQRPALRGPAPVRPLPRRPGARFDDVPDLAALGPDPLPDGIDAAELARAPRAPAPADQGRDPRPGACSPASATSRRARRCFRAAHRSAAPRLVAVARRGRAPRRARSSQSIRYTLARPSPRAAPTARRRHRLRRGDAIGRTRSWSTAARARRCPRRRRGRDPPHRPGAARDVLLPALSKVNRRPVFFRRVMVKRARRFVAAVAVLVRSVPGAACGRRILDINAETGAAGTTAGAAAGRRRRRSSGGGTGGPLISCGAMSCLAARKIQLRPVGQLQPSGHRCAPAGEQPRGRAGRVVDDSACTPTGRLCCVSQTGRHRLPPREPVLRPGQPGHVLLGEQGLPGIAPELLPAPRSALPASARRPASAPRRQSQK